MLGTFGVQILSHFVWKPTVCRCEYPTSARVFVCGIVRSRTAGNGLGFPATPFLSTVLWALHDLMYRGENSPLPGLRATSQNILWSTMKVNEACAWPPHVT